ncbi:hypothetical protein [Burkholderia alba]|uniref:hypothetical protein n=1 Tax=Burkholderia alba TaxID=2683677 RepID=UPI002B05556F|nr:hypothetical protein [Burkholderia alba]
MFLKILLEPRNVNNPVSGPMSGAVMLWSVPSRFCRSAVVLSLSFSPCEAPHQTAIAPGGKIIVSKQAMPGGTDVSGKSINDRSLSDTPLKIELGSAAKISFKPC